MWVVSLAVAVPAFGSKTLSLAPIEMNKPLQPKKYEVGMIFFEFYEKSYLSIQGVKGVKGVKMSCLLYTSDAADE